MYKTSVVGDTTSQQTVYIALEQYGRSAILGSNAYGFKGALKRDHICQIDAFGR